MEHTDAPATPSRDTEGDRQRLPCPPREPDRYDRAVAYLTANPEEIRVAWMSPSTHEAGCLFMYATPDGRGRLRPDGCMCGCLTMVHNSSSSAGRYAWTQSLTEAIHADDALPDGASGITPANLPVFARWQRILDVELRRSW